MNTNESRATGSLHIHSENILPIIKKWLYSEHDIFLRELASNALDAIVKRRILESRKEVPVQDHSLDKIEIHTDSEKKTITISDTGIGMTADEAVKYLSQIAFSGAEEFMKTYQMKDGFIGHFGLGFFSSFMVADRVSVTSRSAREVAGTIVWSSDGSTNYTIEPSAQARDACGTDVALFVNQESLEFLDTNRLKECLRRFCRFFPVPIYVNGEKMNTEAPVWTKSAQETTEPEYIELFRKLYPMQEDPLFWVHINIDYPFHVQGILYFPSKLPKEYESSKGGVLLYCNRVFVSDSCKDILPEYLSIMRGVIDSPDIPLNVSRSHLQVDKTVKTLSTHIAKKVSDALVQLAKTDRSKFEAVWPSCELIVKLGMLEDDKFYDRLFETLLFKIVPKESSAPANTYRTIGEMLSHSASPFMYCDPGQEKSPIVKKAVEKGREVVVTTSALDHPLMSKIEKRAPEAVKGSVPPEGVQFRRVDSYIADEILDPDREKTVLDAEGKTEASKIADFFRKALQQEEKPVEVQAKSLSIDAIPAIITLDEEDRRMRDYSQRFLQGGEESFWKNFRPKSTLVINTNNPTIRSIVRAEEKAPDLAHEMAQYVVSLARLLHNELSQSDFEKFVAQSTTLLGHVADRF